MTTAPPMGFIRRRNLSGAPVAATPAQSSLSLFQSSYRAERKKAVSDLIPAIDQPRTVIRPGAGLVRLDRLDSAVGYLTFSSPRGLPGMDFLWEIPSFPVSQGTLATAPDLPNRRKLVELTKDASAYVINLRHISLLRRMLVVVNGEDTLNISTATRDILLPGEAHGLEIYVHSGEIYLRGYFGSQFPSQKAALDYFGMELL